MRTLDSNHTVYKYIFTIRVCFWGFMIFCLLIQSYRPYPRFESLRCVLRRLNHNQTQIKLIDRKNMFNTNVKAIESPKKFMSFTL